MTAPVTITVSLNNPTEEPKVRAWLTLTPGLVVYESLRDPGWVVAHQRTGLTVGLVADPESAHAMAVELGTLADWTLSGEDLLSQWGLADEVEKIRRKGLPIHGRTGRAIDRNALA